DSVGLGKEPLEGNVRSHERTILLTLAIVLTAALTRPAEQRPDAPGPVERPWTHPKTPWGDPDLEGDWTTDDNFSVPLERPVGFPFVMFPTGYNNNVKILQTRGYVTITHEMIHDTRIVPLDGRPHLSPAIRQYMGDSRGRWEGNTLVIDVTNFHPNITTFHPTARFRGSGATLHLIERYTRTGPDQMRYEVTVDDPNTFERPYTRVLDLKSQESIYEYACHEGNRGHENIRSAA